MANPQAEDGHIDIANEIAEALCRINLSAYESRVLWVLWRKTYGWHKKADHISYTQFEKMTGINRRHVARTLKRLIERKIVTSTGNGRNIKYSFQKDYERWEGIADKQESLPKEVTNSTSLPLQEKSLPKEVMRTLPKEVNTKENKETIQKKPYIVIFELWNSLRIVQHRKLTDDIKKAINTTLSTYSLEEMKQAIQNYAEILADDQYYFKYRWTLKDFLRRGLEKFLDLQIARQNYKKVKGGGNATHRGSDRTLPTTYKSPEQHREAYRQKMDS